MSVLSELEPFQAHQPRQRLEKTVPRGSGPPHVARSGSSGDSWNPEKGKSKHVTLSVPSSTSESVGHVDRGRNLKPSVSTPENRSTASDSNSHSEDSNDELLPGNHSRHRHDPEVQSKKEGDGSRQAHGDGTEVDPSLDPKKAKR